MFPFVSLSVKRILNSVNAIVKWQVAFLKGNVFIEVIYFSLEDIYF